MGAVLFVEHKEDAPAGLAAEWARSAGLSTEVLQVDAGTAFPDPRAFDGVVVLGSSASVYDRTLAWIAPELAFVRTTLAAEVPVLGICFGGQLLSQALGGHVGPSPDGGEVGWVEVESDDPDRIPPGPWVQFHFDVFTVPPGATELARSPVGPQAFQSGPHLGLQFHPEVDEAIGMDWARDESGRLAERGIDAAGLRNDPSGWALARADAMRLFDAWWSRSRRP
jgi:GMP synthase-like glutamine amidotransferase